MKRTRFGARRTMPRKTTRRRRTLTRQALELRLAFDVSPPPILQWFEGGYNTIEQRVPDIFAAGYGAVLTPPPGRADTCGAYLIFARRSQFMSGVMKLLGVLGGTGSP